MSERDKLVNLNGSNLPSVSDVSKGFTKAIQQRYNLDETAAGNLASGILQDITQKMQKDPNVFPATVEMDATKKRMKVGVYDLEKIQKRSL